MKKNEMLGIYNVTFNNKQSTPIYLKDIECVENAIIDDVIDYVKGWHNVRRDKGMGANHIKLHLDPNSDGYITIEELLNLGNSLREYLKLFKEPFVDGSSKNAVSKNYEWQNENGVRFRCVIDKQDKTKRGEGHIPPLSPSNDVIITFYSDRNLNKKMIFKNPKVEEYYSSKDDYSVVEEIKKEIAENDSSAEKVSSFQKRKK